MRYSSCPNGRVTSALCCALRILDAATICIARVICAVLLMDLMRRRISESWHSSPRRFAAGCLPRLLEFARGCLQIAFQGLAEGFFLLYPGEHLAFPRCQEIR